MKNTLRLNHTINTEHGFEDINLYYNSNYIGSIMIDNSYYSINYRIKFIKERL